MVERFSMSVIILVEHLEKSMKKLKAQVSKVQQMRKGIHFMRDEIHMDEEEHDFEAWLEGEGDYLKAHIPGDIIPNISSLHRAWYQEYMKIFSLYFGESGRSWFGNKDRQKALNIQELEKLEIYYTDLMEFHELLLHKFDILKLRVSSSREIDDADIDTTKKLVI